MSEVMTQIVLASLSTALVCVLVTFLVIDLPRRLWLHGLALGLGVLAVAIPAWTLTATLGAPDPWPPAGRYEVLGWKTDERQRAIYVFAAARGQRVPHHYRVPFTRELALDLQRVREQPGTVAGIGMRVRPGAGARPEVRFSFTRAARRDGPRGVP